MRVTSVGALVALLVCGCGYSIRPPFNRDIHKVYVPVFQSTVFSRNLNTRLTELLQQEIRNRTPYKVVGTAEEADAKIEGNVQYTDRLLGVYNPNNLPRQLTQNIMVQVKFIDLCNNTEVQKTLPPVPVNDLASFFPELGETSQLGEYKVMQRIVEQIVGMMEERWEGGQTPAAKP
jgi:hypothetical protein